MFMPLVVRAFYIGIIFKRSCRQAGRGLIRASLYAAVKLYAGLGKGRLGSAAYSAANQSVGFVGRGIGGGALNALSEAGIRVLAGVSGDADSRVDEFVEGTLVFGTEANCSHSHEHGEGGSCKEHGCGHGSCGK